MILIKTQWLKICAKIQYETYSKVYAKIQYERTVKKIMKKKSNKKVLFLPDNKIYFKTIINKRV